jgi:ParD-like antitoxin of type II bacterial toxin-antitoxin system
MREHQISVPIADDLREFIEREARREHRSIAGQLRYWAELRRQATEQPGQIGGL